MEEISKVLDRVLNQDLNQIILSNPRKQEEGNKVKVRPVILKDKLLFQETLYKGTKVFHDNFEAEQMKQRICEYLEGNFRQGEIAGAEESITVLVSKKGKITLVTNKGLPEKREALTHNRVKKYLLPEGEPVDFLVGLGVQSADGHVVKAKYDKFRQINRYLEFIEDILSELPLDRTVRIIDFGCGKSYLTFAMYYYLHEKKKYRIDVTGLDLKEDVIQYCNKLAEEYGYEGLHFEKGDISTYEGTNAVDMVVTLHACDTATDYALAKAVSWGASVIMAVPCCQHEVNRQIDCEQLKPILKYGYIKERMSALITDALRAELLEEQGYEVQILEFIDMEHTPKNLLIRAVKRPHMKSRGTCKAEEAASFLNVSTTLQRLLK